MSLSCTHLLLDGAVYLRVSFVYKNKFVCCQFILIKVIPSGWEQIVLYVHRVFNGWPLAHYNMVVYHKWLLLLMMMVYQLLLVWRQCGWYRSYNTTQLSICKEQGLPFILKLQFFNLLYEKFKQNSKECDRQDLWTR